MSLTVTEKTKLRKLLAELKARNIELPDDVKDTIRGVQKAIVWPEQLIKPDGGIYNPLGYQKGFIDSNALFGSRIRPSWEILKKLLIESPSF